MTMKEMKRTVSGAAMMETAATTVQCRGDEDDETIIVDGNKQSARTVSLSHIDFPEIKNSMHVPLQNREN